GVIRGTSMAEYKPLATTVNTGAIRVRSVVARTAHSLRRMDRKTLFMLTVSKKSAAIVFRNTAPVERRSCAYGARHRVLKSIDENNSEMVTMTAAGSKVHRKCM